MNNSIAESEGKMKRKIRGRKNRKIPAAAVLLGLMFLLSGCGAASIRQQTSVDTAMGTIVTQTLYVRQERGQTEQESGAEEGTEGESAAVMELLTELERQELSWRIEGSEVARINARASAAAIQAPAGEAAGTDDGTGAGVFAGASAPMPGEPESIPVSSSMQDILGQIWQISTDSKGALDVTLGRLSRLWNLDELTVSAVDGQAYIPGSEQIQSAMEDTGFARVQLSGGTITLPGGMQLDLGAVGKGIACDRISAYLHSQPQVTGAVVAVGGSVVTYGKKPDDSPWKVAIMHPREEGNYLGVLSLTGEHFISTSGDYERYVLVDGVRYHHILDPSTGYPARSGLCSVTIVCDSGLQADALSTACFVLGAERGLALTETYGAEALFVDEDGVLYMTEGMKEIFSAGR